jgi:dihydroxyacetone kinase-like protein
MTSHGSLQLHIAERAALAAADALEGACDELCKLDAAAGDGDHGFAMAEAARNVRSAIAIKPISDLDGLLNLAADAFAAVGGAMGALAYVFLQALRSPEIQEARRLSAEDLAELLRLGEAAVITFAGAKVGDKTVVDAVVAARTAAEESARVGRSLSEALTSAAAGAREGAAATADMVARIGRASRLGERSRGTVDAGATSFAIVLSALADAYAAESSVPSQSPGRTGF